MQPSAVAPLVVRGMVPALGGTPFAPELSVSIDGVAPQHTKVGPGAFEMRLVSVGSGLHRVVLRFSEERDLPAPDGRRVGGRLTRIAFESLAAHPSAWTPATDGTADILPVGGPLGLGAGWGSYETWQGESFRWMGASAQLAVLPNTEVALRLTAEPGASLAGKPCELRIADRSGRLIDKVSIAKRGGYDIILPPLPAEAQPITLQVTGDLVPAPGDGRILALRVLQIAPRP